MAMQMPEIYELMDGLPPGAWVAIFIKEQRVISVGEDALTVFEEARRQDVRVPFIGRVPGPSVTWAF